MLVRYSQKFRKNIYEIYIGEHVVTNERNVLLSTVLGPCVAVCLKDKEKGIIGMNHFMLPGKSEANDRRYGMDSFNGLLDDMLKKGSDLKRLKAKVFGGANLYNNSGSPGNANIDFIKDLLTRLGVKIKVDDTGSSCARRLYYCSDTFSVLLHRFGKNCPIDLVTNGALVV